MLEIFQILELHTFRGAEERYGPGPLQNGALRDLDAGTLALLKEVADAWEKERPKTVRSAEAVQLG